MRSNLSAFSRHMRTIKTMALCAGLAAGAHVQASVVTQNTVGDALTGGSGFTLGQSITTSATSNWDHLTFNFVDSAGAAYANGSIFVLTNDYYGPPSELNNGTVGFLASTSAITDGAWDFDDAVTLSANTTYFFYMNTPLDGTRQVRFSGVNPYAGGEALLANSGEGYNNFSGVDSVFSLNGAAVNGASAAVPEPGSLALVGLAFFGAVAARRRTVAKAGTSATPAC